MRMRPHLFAVVLLGLGGCSSSDSGGGDSSGAIVPASGASAGASGGGGGGSSGAAAAVGGTGGSLGGSKGGSAGSVGVAGFPSGGGSAGASGAGQSGGAGAAGSTEGQGGDAGATAAGGGGTGGAAGSANCKTMCLGVECGPIPDGCGTTLDCGDCGGSPGMTCIKHPNPMWITRVHNAISATIMDHPTYFDVADMMGGQTKVVDLASYRDAVVALVDGNGATCIADPNDPAEIRVKGTTDEAENYRLVTSAGYTSYTYTSTCSPAGF